MFRLGSFDLKKSVAGLEDGIITISGPALAISGIIAGVDLVTGGNILKSMPAFTMAWAITLLLTLDFQVLALGVRAHRVYLSHKVRKVKIFEIILAIAIAAAISFVSIQMQSIIARVNAENITIDAAAMQLGISTLALIWERSTLVLVLIFMSGWLREHDSAIEAPVQALPQVVTPGLDTLIETLDARYQQRMEALYQHTVETVKFTIAEATNPQMQVIAAPQEDKVQKTREFLMLYPRATDEELAQHLGITRSAAAHFWRLKVEENGLANQKQIDEGTNDEQPIFTGRFASKEQDVARVLQANPQATIEEVARAADCSERTAERWIQKLQEAR